LERRINTWNDGFVTRNTGFVVSNRRYGRADREAGGAGMVVSLNSVPLKARCRMANRPIHEIRLGKVKAAIWRNELVSGEFIGTAGAALIVS